MIFISRFFFLQTSKLDEFTYKPFL
jgi:hypothetical protein